MAILVTGGAGYIGTHTCIELLAAGFEVVVVDNLCNSKYEAVRRVESVSGKAVAFHELDVNDRSALAEVFKEHKIDAVIHFAGLKAVGESTQKPLLYYHNNVGGSVAVSEVMLQFGVSCILFSSTATVYGEPESSPIPETFPTCPEHPYGRSKLMVEELLRDCCKSPDSPWRVGLLRYFNPIGAHHSGMLGEDPQGIPNNLLPYVSQVAIGKLEKLRVFGGDYPTVDGTGVRDYIHVVDLARGHVKALQKLLASSPCCLTYNLGTGRGVSVLQIVKAFEKACGKPIPYEVVARRPGDLAEYFGDPSLAREELGWTAEFGIERMVEDTWRWQSANPRGYDD